MDRLLEHLGLEDIRPLGNEIGARCPKHPTRESKPDNWSINRLTGAHHCFACGYSGSLITLVMDMTGQSLWLAHQTIREFEVELTDVEPEPVVDRTTVLQAYERFGEPPQRAVERRKLTMPALQTYGVRWDATELAWVFPIRSPHGTLWGYQIKAAEFVRNRPPGIKKSQTLFGLDVLKGPVPRLTVVESPLDAVYLYSLGYPAVATFGANVSDAQLRLLIEYAESIVLALDNDQAGLVEMRRILRLKWHHRMPFVIFNYEVTPGKDPGEATPEQVHAGHLAAVIASFW